MYYFLSQKKPTLKIADKSTTNLWSYKKQLEKYFSN